MAARKPGFTLERHREVGEELNRIQRYLTNLAVEVGGKYPVKNSARRRLERVDKLLSSARSALDKQLEADLAARNMKLPDLEFVNVYYGGEPEPKGS